MKKNQWILIAVMAVVLVLILVVANRLGQPNDNGETLPDNGTTETTGGETEETKWLPADEALALTTFEEYNAMTADQQQAFSAKFSSVKAFINWYWEAKAIYDDKQDVIIIGPGGGIDIEDILGTSAPKE